MMAIIINIDVMLPKRKMSVTELAGKVGITIANLSIRKNGCAKAIRSSTFEGICKALDCQPGDILEFTNDAADRRRVSAPVSSPASSGSYISGYGRST